MYRRRKNVPMTHDLRMRDLLHRVVPSQVANAARCRPYACRRSAGSSSLMADLAHNDRWRRWDIWLAAAKKHPRVAWRWWRNHTVPSDPQNVLRDEPRRRMPCPQREPVPIVSPKVPMAGLAARDNRFSPQVLT